MEGSLETLMTVQQTVINFLVDYSFQIIGAILILIAGAVVAAKVGRIVEKQMLGREIDVTLSRFTGGGVRLLLLAIFVIIALSNVGVSITPLIAAIGALSIGVGLAIQGMLSNYAAGFTIILTRPFVVGDTIQVQGVGGVVDAVHLGYTILVDEDEVRIQIPNRLIIGEILHNSEAESLVELSVGVAYSTAPDAAITAVRCAIENLDMETSRPAVVGIERFGDSSIDIGARFWVPTRRKYELQYAANRAIHRELEKAGIAIPFPQREVRLLNETSNAG